MQHWTFGLSDVLNSRFAYIIGGIHTLKFYSCEPLTFLLPGSNPLRSNRSVLNVSKRPLDKSQSSKVCQLGVRQTQF